MIQLSVINRLLAVVFCCCWGLAQADDNLYVFVFKDGAVQKNISIVVGDVRQPTNEFGLAAFSLPNAEYEVGYYKNDEMFALTEVRLLENQQSQIFLNLTKTGADVELDLPLAAYGKDFDHQQAKPQTGPKGNLKLSLKNSKTGEVVVGAKLFFKGQIIEATSDENGIVQVELVAGVYDISVIHPNFIMKVLKDIKVEAKATTEKTVALVKADIVMDEFVVTAPAVEGSLSVSLAELKDSAVLGDAISSEQFSKSGDSSASGALKRVTGITVVDGKFVFIRGLGERYSTILLNNLHIPSPEPTKRVVPLDIFPTSVIQSMSIQKTHSSDLPGTFAGGAVLITTKDIPKEDNYAKAEVGLVFNSSTGQRVAYNGDNAHGMPSSLLSSSDNFSVLTEEVRIGNTIIAEGLSGADKKALNKAMMNYRSYGLEKRKLQPGKSAAVSFGQSFKTGGGLKYGVAGSLYYKTSEKSTQIIKDEYEYDQLNDINIHTDTGQFDVTRITQKYGGMVSVGLDTLEGNQVKYTLLSLNETSDITNLGKKDDLDEDTYSERTYLQYAEKGLVAHQFNGEHHFGAGDAYLDNLIIKWGAETASASRIEPGTFEYEYKQVNDQMVLDSKKLFYLYSDLNDKVENYRLDFTLPFKYNKRDNYTQLGLFEYKKSRELDSRRFKIKYNDNLDPYPIDSALSEGSVDAGTVDILDSYKPDDFYTAEQNVSAFYVKQLVSPLEKLDVLLGLRQEVSTQSLRVGQEEDSYALDTTDLLPSLGATWRFDAEHQLRFAFSQTISRPDFREFSPNRYKDPLTGYIIYGYENLKYTTITNLDLKYEWYPSHDESYSVAVFSKDFINPIETVRTISDVDIETSYRNAQSATSLGLELGFRKNLEGLFSSLKHYYVAGNYAMIDSIIVLDKNAPENQNDQFIPFLTSENRAMQGQSPYIVNMQLGYDNFFTRRSAVLLYNVSGERISALGINGNPDVYEQPFHKLDFVVKWGLNDTYDEQVKRIGYNITFKAINLLDSEVKMKQGDKTSMRFFPGRSYSLYFSMKF